MRGCKAALAVALVAAMSLQAGCRAIFLDGRQDVYITAAPGTPLMIDGAPAYPGMHSLSRSRDHVVSTPSGWSQRIDSHFHWSFVAWFLLFTGPFEFLDFANGTAYALDPTDVNVPPQPPTNP